MYQLLFVVFLSSALLSAEAGLTGRGKGGTTFVVKEGYWNSVCKVGLQCQGKRLDFPSVARCAQACADDRRCRCAIYRPKDGFCSFKIYSCAAPKTGLRRDPTQTHKAIAVRRPVRSGGLTGPTPIPREGDPPVASGVYRSTMTTFDGFGQPYGGCGVPLEDMRDDNNKPLPFIALNRFNSMGTYQPQPLFASGSNCGRWVKITVKNPCGTPNDGSNIASCLANWGAGPGDRNSGKEMYGYVADSCGDANAWCRQDTNHIDISSGYLRAVGAFDAWANNRIEWQFLSDTPPGWTQNRLKFRWCKDAKELWLCFIVTNTPNGISDVDVKLANGNWARAAQMDVLGNQYIAPQAWGEVSKYLDLAGNQYTVRPFDVQGRSYGDFKLNKPTGADTVTNAQ